MSCTVELHLSDAGYPDRLYPSGKFVGNSAKEICLEVTGHQLRYSTLFWLIEIQIRRGRKVWTQADCV